MKRNEQNRWPVAQRIRLTSRADPAGWATNAALIAALLALFILGALMDDDNSPQATAHAAEYAAGIEEGRRQALSEQTAVASCTALTKANP